MESLRVRVLAGLAMVAYCGTAMAIAIGVIVITATWVMAGVVAAIVAGCVLFALRIGHRSHGAADASADDREYDRLS